MMQRILQRVVIWTVLLAAYAAIAWIAGLVLSPWLVYQLFAYMFRLRRALARTTRCPDGHEVAQWGRFRCGCGAETLSWVWRCPWCRARFGHTSCPTCGLSTGNPLLGA